MLKGRASSDAFRRPFPGLEFTSSPKFPSCAPARCTNVSRALRLFLTAKGGIARAAKTGPLLRLEAPVPQRRFRLRAVKGAWLRRLGIGEFAQAYIVGCVPARSVRRLSFLARSISGSPCPALLAVEEHT